MQNIQKDRIQEFFYSFFHPLHILLSGDTVSQETCELF